MLYLIYHAGYETGDNLSQALKENIDYFKKIRFNLNFKKIRKTDLFIRWGDTRDKELDDSIVRAGATILNKATAILRNTNKLKSLDILKRENINVPNIFTRKDDINTFPVLGRDRSHHGGTDIVFINGNKYGNNDYSKIPTKDFYTEFIPSDIEYRVHVFCGEIVRVTRKSFRGHDKDGNIVEKKSVIRNDTFGWGHSHIDIDSFVEAHPKSAKIALRAVSAIGLDFGAVDIIIAKENNQPYVLEVNSCPRLNSIGIDLYVDLIKTKYEER